MALPPGVSFEERHNFTFAQAELILSDAMDLTSKLTGEQPSVDAVFASAASMLSNKQIIQVQAPQIGLAPILNRH